MSLLMQKAPSPITIVTSTPSSHIQSIADRFEVRYLPHQNQTSIGGDWNKAFESCTSKWVTLAHQDDIYYPEYAAEVKKNIELYPDASIFFTHYDEIKNDEVVSNSYLVILKKFLLEFGFFGRAKIDSRWAKTNCLRFGCAIPCPAITLKRDPNFHFDESLKVNLDWDAWLRLAQCNGSFVWIRKSLMAHRIHDGQESISAILSGVRQREDLMLLKRLWPLFLAHLIEKTYRLMR